MNLTDIKQALYEQKPVANLLHIRKIGVAVILVYGCNLEDPNDLPNLFFEIPVEELGDGLHVTTMEAQLLIRYIVQPETYGL